MNRTAFLRELAQRGPQDLEDVKLLEIAATLPLRGKKCPDL